MKTTSDSGKLQHITFTGIDGKTDLERLWEIQQEYPIAEFGVLVSKNWQENGNRYFNPSYLEALRYRSHSMNLSVHLCGNIARAAVNGNWEPFKEWAGTYPFFFNRCQINISTSKKNPERFIYEGEATHFKEIILQQRSANDCPLYINSKDNTHVSALMDASGGRGVDTPTIPFNDGHKIGYAGGINENNVAEKLSFLEENELVGNFWIDMESGVRTNDWFDLDKIVKVLEICNEIVPIKNK